MMRVEIGQRVLELGEQERLTFGRARDCTVCLDPEDTGISRVAGTILAEQATWWLVNSSGTRPLAIVDEFGLRSVLAPGRRTAVETPTTVLVDGTRGQHGLRLRPPATPTSESALTGTGEMARADGTAGAGAADTPPEDAATAIGAEVMVSEADRLAMVALFAGYLEEPPRYDPYPKSYAAAAARLGCPRTTLVKRIEYLRTRLDAAGVPNMTGYNALVNLAEYAISRRLVTRADLARLRR